MDDFIPSRDGGGTLYIPYYCSVPLSRSFVVITLLFFVLVGVSLSVSISEGDHFAAERGEGGKVAENRKISIGLHTRRVLIPPLIATHRHSVPKIINSL